ncbi:MAG TPA: polysaccharide deacetylase family protein [Roseiarcus sp.]
MGMKNQLIAAGFTAFRLSRLHKALAPMTRGQGVILMFHRVRPFEDPGFAPNRLLEITPESLDAALDLTRRLGFEFVTLSEARRRLVHGGRRFAALTFDDGYRDTRDNALPVLERHEAPFTVFFAPGFIERTARLWWIELEEAVRRLDAIAFERDGVCLRLPAGSLPEKNAAFARIYWALRARPEQQLLDAAAALARQAGVDGTAIADALFMDWSEATAFARHPLVSAGAHTMTHRMLAKWPADVARAEMAESKAALEARMGPIEALAYPVGDPTSAGRREFELARELGFSCAVTTRPGMLFPGHAAHLTALPRVSVNGLWQGAGAMETLLSGAPFLLWNRGRRLNVA